MGFDMIEVDARADTIMESLEGCDAFMWRFAGSHLTPYARRLMQAISQSRKIALFPGEEFLWHIGDKISGQKLMEACGIPTPKTWFYFDKKEACSFLEEAYYPLVFKLNGGGKSVNVCLLENKRQAEFMVDVMFSHGVHEIWQAKGSWSRILTRNIKDALEAWAKRKALPPRHQGYCIFQEYIPGNNFDLRFQIIGRKVIAFKRHNRPNDFRASGSGLVDYNPKEVTGELVKEIYGFSKKMKMPFVSLDVIFNNSDPLVLEANYNYVAAVPNRCPGYWTLRDKDFEWTKTPPHAERFTFEEFVHFEFPGIFADSSTR